MSNPKMAIMAGWASKEAAMGLWADLPDNDNLAVVGINIGFGKGTPAEKEVCWIILPISALDSEFQRSPDGVSQAFTALIDSAKMTSSSEDRARFLARDSRG